MKKLDGKISIGRWSDGEVRIEIMDERAGVMIVQARLDLTTYAEVITGLSHCSCSLEYNDSGAIGMVAENKTELVPVPSSEKRPYGNEGWISAALAPFEVDGWKARAGDMTNHHCWSRDGGQEYQQVVFFRHVPAPDNPDAPPKRKRPAA